MKQTIRNGLVMYAVALVLLASAFAGDSATGSGAPVSLRVEVDDNAPLVQEKVLVTARVLFDESIRDGALTAPELEGALLERVGDDETSTVIRGGKRYTEVVRRYALFPQRSGPVRVPPLTFEAVQRAPRRRGARRSLFADPFGDPFAGAGSPFGSSLFDDFFGGGQSVRVRSNAIDLDVQAKPEEAAGRWWLPAQRVELVDEWTPEVPTFRVGEQVTRRVAIQAVGLSDAQLPEIDLPRVDGLKQYAQPAVEDTFTAGEETVAVKLREFAVLPTRPGEFMLPAVEVEWWDVEANEARVATLPAQTIQVAAADGSALSAADIAPAPPVDDAGTGDGELAQGSAWPKAWMISLVGVALALLAAVLMRCQQRKGRAVEADTGPAVASRSISLRSVERDFRRACDANDPRAAGAALAGIGRARWPENPPPNPTAVAERMGGDSLQAAVEQLMRAVYSTQAAPWDGEACARAYAGAKRTGNDPTGTSRPTALPPLYPA